jgi:hypothetical protein
MTDTTDVTYMNEAAANGKTYMARKTFFYKIDRSMVSMVFHSLFLQKLHL